MGATRPATKYIPILSAALGMHMKSEITRLCRWATDSLEEPPPTESSPKPDRLAQSLEVVKLMKERRLAEGLRQVDLSQILGVGINGVYRWEKGQTVIQEKHIMLIEKWLKSVNPKD